MHCEISSKVTMMTPAWCQSFHSGVFFVNFILYTFSNLVDFGQVNVCWVACTFK